MTSDPFLVGNGTKQGGVLSMLALLCHYTCELITGIIPRSHSYMPISTVVSGVV